MKRCPKCPELFSDMMHFCPNDGHPLVPIVAQDPLINSTVDGKYVIEEVIGKGGMGVVYKARHVNFNRQFAVKILKSEFVNDPQAVKRFRNEANAAGAIRHPNAIAITDFNITPDGLAYLVMDLVEGRSLREIIKKEGALGQIRTVKLIGQVCDAVAAAHRKGIIHRDLKPDNIMVESTDDTDDEIVHVLDFGIAKLSQNPAYSENITVGGAILGSPYYMSPEQCDGRQLDTRSDIYSLGIILYEMLTGKVPFRAQTPWGLVKMHCSATPQPLKLHRPDINPQLEQAVLKALLKDPNDRQQTATELKRELEVAISTMKIDELMLRKSEKSSSQQATAPLDPENDVERLLKEQFAPPPPPPPRRPEPPKIEDIPSPVDMVTTPMQALLPEDVPEAETTAVLSGAEMRQELIDAEQKRIAELATELEAEMQLFKSRKSSAEGRKATSALDELSNELSEEWRGYAKPPQAGYQSEHTYQQPQQSVAVAEFFDIAEEFSLALPEMVEDLLISVSESITLKADVLYKRAEAAKTDPVYTPPKPVEPPKAPIKTMDRSKPVHQARVMKKEAEETEAKQVAKFKFKLAMIILGTAILITAVFSYFYFTSEEPAPPPTDKVYPETFQTSPTPVSTQSSFTIPEGMAYINGGSFRMGNRKGDPCIEEERVVEVKPFFIDKYEVTNRRYRDFVEATNHPAPANWKDGKYAPGEADLPVSGVSWQDAVDYCDWRTKVTGKKHRLPTEEEWEFAARSGSAQLYPWGNEWNPAAANTKEQGRGKMVDVGTFRQGENSFGMSDMIGNAAEWTSSEYKPTPGFNCRPAEGIQKIVKGGDYNTPTSEARASYRIWLAPTGGNYTTLGFRCVREVN